MKEQSYSVNRITFWLLLAIFGCGVITSLAGFIRAIYPPLSLVLMIPAMLFLIFGIRVGQTFFSQRLQLSEKILLFVLFLIWLLHFSGVFVPETGFDAVWYHLPIVNAFVQQHRIFYMPDYYQSLNPLFSDLIFLLGFQIWRELGAKLVAFLFGFCFIAVSYQISRQVLNRFWSLIAIVIISTFQVVAWQSSSFYVDVAKATWELSAVWIFLSVTDQAKKLQLGGLFFGASLATKLFSIFLFPTFLFALIKNHIADFLLFASMSLMIVLPFYLYAYRITHNPFYSFAIHEAKLQEIGGQASLPIYVMQRTIALPSSLTQLTLFARDYTSLIFLIFISVFLLYLKKIWQQPKLQFLLFFAVNQWLIWWYIPPLSTRYALSGFVVLLILFLWSMCTFLEKKPTHRMVFLATIGLSIVFNLLPRIIPLKRNMLYLFGKQTKTQYIQQFYDGNIDQHLKDWYGLAGAK